MNFTKEKTSPATVAVIGLGALGLVAMKNLLEEGFCVTGFDRNGYVGGLWHYTEKEQISVIESTVSNGSKQRGAFTDFPFPEDCPDFPLASDMDNYLVSYAKHFGLLPHAKLNTFVHRAHWIEKKNKWEVETSVDGGVHSIELFDKVIYAMGPDQIPNIPKVPGIEKFGGDACHSISFKRPDKWAGKKVLVVGFGNTAADIAGVLADVAEKVYLSHRRGAVVLPRWVEKRPVDHIRTYRKGVFLELLSRYLPGIWMNMMNSVMLGLRDKLYDLKPEWRFDPAPHVNQARPIISDNLVDNLTKGSVISVSSIEEIINSNTVQFTDGEEVEIDSIVWCTGYTVDYSILGDSDPTLYDSDLTSANGRRFPRLYQNLFSLKHPDSLAFMGNLSFMNPAFLMFDIASMAVAQTWLGRSKLPSMSEMNKSVDLHHQWLAELAKSGPVMPGLVKGADWLEWAEDAAGLGLKKNLGYGPMGWYFWLTDKEFCKMMMDGLLLPFHYRLFDDGKRKKWDGARDEIIRVNKDLTERKWV